MPGVLVALLALASGATVANLYYVQPLLGGVARALGVSDATAGLLVTCAQVGYVTGLALLVPLGVLGDTLFRHGSDVLGRHGGSGTKERKKSGRGWPRVCSWSRGGWWCRRLAVVGA